MDCPYICWVYSHRTKYLNTRGSVSGSLIAHCFDSFHGPHNAFSKYVECAHNRPSGTSKFADSFSPLSVILTEIFTNFGLYSSLNSSKPRFVSRNRMESNLLLRNPGRCFVKDRRKALDVLDGKLCLLLRRPLHVLRRDLRHLQQLRDDN